MPRIRILTVVGAVLGALAMPSSAMAAETQFEIFMDDDLLVYRDDQTRDRALHRMKALGADYVRVTVLWSVVAENARKTKARDKRFRKLKASNPKAYPRLNWDRFDRLARACDTLQIGCYFNLTGPGPAWGHKKAPPSQKRNRKTWKPKERAFYDWVVAVGRRYSGRYRDENDGKGLLPRVRFWSLWNEPGQGGWLTPQWENGRPASPHIYRKLYIFGRKALDRTGHAGDTILAGETAPIGSSKQSSRAPIRPKLFLREFFCVDEQNAPLQDEEADERGCGDFDKYGPIRTTAWAHHPYTKKLAPTQPDPHPDSITMANIGDLPAMLDAISASTARIGNGINVVSTEFGYETNPPDPYSGIDPEVQATWMSLGDFLAWLNPRVLANTQFLLRDVAPLRKHDSGSKAYWFTYQSGIDDVNGTPKPAAIAFAFPFLAYPAGPANPETGKIPFLTWGQLRFLPNTLAPEAPGTVQIQWRPADGSSGFQPLADVPVTNHMGFFTYNGEAPGAGILRAFWSGPGVPNEVASREFPIG